MSLTITPSSATSAMYIGFYLGSRIPKAEAHLSGNTFGAVIVLKDANNTNVANFGNTDSTRTLTGVADRVFLNFNPTGNTNPFTVNLGTLQIELGSTATAYEPYQAQSYGINLGKNLLDMTATEQGGIDESGANINNPENWRTTGYISASPNTSYTFSVNDTTGVTSYTVRLYQYDKNKTFISPRTVKADGALTITTGANTMFLRATVYDVGITLDMDKAVALKLMIEAGSTATPYAPYKTPIELAKIGTYQDYIYKSGDDWYIHKAVKKVVWDGSEAWTTATGYVYRTESDAYIPADRYVVADILCDNFTPVSYNAIAGSDYDIALDSNNAGRFAVRHKDYTSGSTFKTWLSTHNTTVYYALATPTDTKITDSDLIDQLEALLAKHTLLEGVNNIFLIPGAAPDGTLTLGYIVYDKYNHHKVYIWNDTAQEWQIIVQ